MTGLVAAIDQGTASTRCLVFDADGREIARDQVEHRQHFPRAGWVEHDPVELLEATRAVVAGALRRGGLAPRDLGAVGVTNQRETVVLWDRRTGRPLARAIVWQDTRTTDLVARLASGDDAARIRERTGLVPSAYFSATKLQWLLDHVDGARAGAERGELCAGTVDSWLVWNLSGGAHHVTDVTNASRTMLMDLETLDWDPELLERFEIPRALLPSVRPSLAAHGTLRLGEGAGEVLLGAILGDQQASLLGHGCVEPGATKCTYGTGTFLLCNTGATLVRSTNGLLSTVAFQRDGSAPQYALEGAVAVGGAAVKWLRDQLGLVAHASDTARLARELEDRAGLYFVPAFSGLYAPHWRPDARGLLIGLTAAHGRAHLVRATLEAIAFQAGELVEAVVADTGRPLQELRVDGGVSTNEVAMQIQADLLGVEVRRAATSEATALGVARAAGVGAGLWDVDSLAEHRASPTAFVPSWSPERRGAALAGWRRAVERAIVWLDQPELA